MPKSLVLCGLFALPLVWGCGGGATPAPTTPVANNAAAAVAPPADPRSPDQVVREFLAGSQKGDTTAKLALLTPAARAEWEKAEKSGTGFSMGVDASPTLTFTVGDVELVGETKQEAHVASQLTDKDGEGNPVTESIVWFLLQEPEGWRVSGMAMNVIDGELPLILDFEDQAEMERKILLLNQEIARRELDAANKNAVQTTSNPGTNNAKPTANTSTATARPATSPNTTQARQATRPANPPRR